MNLSSAVAAQVRSLYFGSPINA